MTTDGFHTDSTAAIPVPGKLKGPQRQVYRPRSFSDFDLTGLLKELHFLYVILREATVWLIIGLSVQYIIQYIIRHIYTCAVVVIALNWIKAFQRQLVIVVIPMS